MVEKKFSIKHVVKNFSSLVSEYSQQEEHFGIPWRIRCWKFNDKLAVYLLCEKPKNEARFWLIDTTFEMTLGEEKLAKQTAFQFEDVTGYGWSEFGEWEDVIKDHMINDCVTVVCNVTIGKMWGIVPERTISFDEPPESFADMVVLKIGEQKFYVLRSLLAFRSPYFRVLFFGNFSESKESEVELKEVDADDFQCFLEVIYGELAIQAEIVEGVLKLADLYDVKFVAQKCEKFLSETNEVLTRTKLRLADEYGLEKLKKDCLNSMSTMEEIKNCIPSDVTSLHHSTLAALLEKVLILH